MKWFLYAVSLFWIAMGCSAILYTAGTRRAYKRFIQGPDRRILAVITVVAGVLFLAAAPATHYPWFIRLLGIIAVIKAGFIFFDPFTVWEKITHWCLNTLSDQAYRFSGIVNVILGTAVLSWIL